MSDLIERKDLEAAIDNWLAIDRYYHPYSKQKTIPVPELVDIIKLLPSAQPERKKGKWIYYPKASGSISSTAMHLYPVCSECGCEHPIANYCPNCGCAMKGEDE